MPNFKSGSIWAVISLDTLGEEDTESMIMVDPPEDQGGDDGRSMVIVGPQVPADQESPTTQTPKRSPQSYNTHGGLKKRKRGAGGQSKQLPNKNQDLQVWLLIFPSNSLKVCPINSIRSPMKTTTVYAVVLASSSPGSRACHWGAAVAGHQHQACRQGSSSRTNQEDPHQKRQQPGLWWGTFLFVHMYLCCCLFLIFPLLLFLRLFSWTSLRPRQNCLMNQFLSRWVQL